MSLSRDGYFSGMEGEPVDTWRWVLRRHGLIGTGVLAATHVAQIISRRVYLHERHMWYALSTAAVPLVPLAEGLSIQTAGSPEIDLLLQADLCSRMTARHHLAHGAELWLVREGERAAFCCWIFRKRMPVFGARGGWQALPAHTVCLEDSMTASAYRGRGIAPAAWSLIAHHLHQTGIGTMVTKVEERNTASRRAVLKAGFREMAMIDRWHVGGLSRMHCELGSSVLAQDLETLVSMQRLAI